jgi:hypothetical protein
MESKYREMNCWGVWIGIVGVCESVEVETGWRVGYGKAVRVWATMVSIKPWSGLTWVAVRNGERRWQAEIVTANIRNNKREMDLE